VRGSLHLNREVIPRILIRVAGNTGWHPLCVDVVPDIPFVSTRNPALVSPRKAHTVEELVYVELKSLRSTQIAAVEVDVVGEAMESRYQSVISVGHTLGRKISNQMVIPEDVGVVHVSADVVLRGV